jgi:probable rRNA maturation factor
MIRRKLRTVLRDLALHESELSVLFTDDKTISGLNQRYLGRHGPTDVLAFPMLNGSSFPFATALLGDVVISVDTAAAESVRLGEVLERTIFRLLIHGILHLLGYDHDKSPREAARMTREQNRLLALIKDA